MNKIILFLIILTTLSYGQFIYPETRAVVYDSATTLRSTLRANMIDSASNIVNDSLVANVRSQLDVSSMNVTNLLIGGTTLATNVAPQINDSIDVVRDTLRADIGDTSVVLRTYSRTQVKDSLSILYYKKIIWTYSINPDSMDYSETVDSLETVKVQKLPFITCTEATGSDSCTIVSFGYVNKAEDKVLRFYYWAKCISGIQSKVSLEWTRLSNGTLADVDSAVTSASLVVKSVVIDDLTNLVDGEAYTFRVKGSNDADGKLWIMPLYVEVVAQLRRDTN